MKILVTGGLGFIGSNFILIIKKRFPTWKITNLDAESFGSNKKNLDQIKKDENYQYVKGNITNANLIGKLISQNDFVINFAAESHVDRSINNPESFIKSNYVGTYTILEAIKKYKKTLIQISTDEVFGSLKNQTATENFPYNPSSPYASTKAAAELLVKSYVTTFGCKAIITRCTNNFGPRQSLEKLIPKIISLANKNKKIPIYGNGKNVRDWIFVEDHCNAIIDILLKGKSGQSYNISASNEVDNLTIVNTILKIMKKPKKLIKFTKDRPGHDFRYSLDSSKIKKELKWKIKNNFEDGIKKTIEWYIQNPELIVNISTKELSKAEWKTR
ncbi:MAG: dTDP-glucose 4,6-dehydratase [Candidatus Nitrosopumilus sp. bin_32a]